jgi:hypothetical protein
MVPSALTTIFVIAIVSLPFNALARDLRGHVEVRGVFYPHLDLVEERARLLARYEGTFGNWQIVASACGDGVIGTKNRVTDAILRPLETFLEYRGSKAEVRVGLSSVAWGVLDELSPQDVVSPVDVSRWILDGRSEGRLPVPLARVRLFLPASLTLEGLIVPFARRGWYDQLDETHSPFAPPGFETFPRSESDWQRARELSGDLMEGGIRFRGTGSGLDWGLSAYRDIVDFDQYQFTPAGVTAQRPTRWMAGADMEVARGNWVVRFDGAAYLDDPLQQAGQVPTVVRHDTYRAGVGVDRRVGESSLYFNALYSYIPGGAPVDQRSELSVFGGFTRDFTQGTRNVRIFGLWNAESESGFTRLVWDQELVENLRLDVSGGVFWGQGGSAFRSFDDADFVTVRMRFYF